MPNSSAGSTTTSIGRRAGVDVGRQFRSCTRRLSAITKTRGVPGRIASTRVTKLRASVGLVTPVKRVPGQLPGCSVEVVHPPKTTGTPGEDFPVRQQEFHGRIIGGHHQTRWRLVVLVASRLASRSGSTGGFRGGRRDIPTRNTTEGSGASASRTPRSWSTVHEYVVSYECRNRTTAAWPARALASAPGTPCWRSAGVEEPHDPCPAGAGKGIEGDRYSSLPDTGVSLSDDLVAPARRPGIGECHCGCPSTSSSTL